jgi:lysophospholipase L1-like esterase
MKNYVPCFHLVLIVCLCLASAQAASAETDFYTIPLTSTNIYVQGAQFVTVDTTGMHFNRFNNDIYSKPSDTVKVDGKKARTTSGIKLTLYTRSDTVRLTFHYVPRQENRNSHFGLYQNGTFVQNQHVSRSELSAVINLVSRSTPGELVRHDVVLPNWSNPILSQLELKTGMVLEDGNPFPDKKIVFLGDSITHGVGQNASYQTYPFLAAEALHAELFNLAVGGGKISPPVADLLQYFGPVDAIWILVGYNNWQGGSEPLDSITSAYEALLATVREHQPEAEVFCSTLTSTTNTIDRESGVTVDEIRKGVAGVVNARIAAGDTHLHLVNGDDYSDETDLNDAVHFNTAGAAKVGRQVFKIISPLLSD